MVSDMRRWIREEHLADLLAGEWVPMYDDVGRVLPGIEGKHGVRIMKPDGTRIGGDLIKMRPGSEFPLHVHEGEHVIIFLAGKGLVHINGVDEPVVAMSTVAIHGEYPHGVKACSHSSESLVFFAVGHPHHEVDSTVRMRIIES